MTPNEMARLHAMCFAVPRPWSKDEFGALLACSHVFAAGNRHGFALGRAIAGEAELLTLAIAPEHRRRGLGRHLLASFEREARRRGARSAFLEVSADNIPAIALYAAAGYREAGRRSGYYRHGNSIAIDAILMRRILPAGA